MSENRKPEGKKPFDPSRIWGEFETGKRFKSGLGTRGIYDQSKMNERYFVGDQWYGVNCGNERPLVRHNVIKRIGDYKMAVIGASPVSVNYSADGVPNTIDLKDKVRPIREGLSSVDEEMYSAATMDMEEYFEQDIPVSEEVSLVMSALSDYFRVTAERVKFDDVREQALRNSYISGTGIVYTWWDDQIRTGLYADEGRTTPVRGDIACEVLDIENVYFGDPNRDNIQDQPYILVAERKPVSELRREARRNKVSEYDISQIKPDSEKGYEAGERAEDEPPESKKATVITRFWKEWDKEGKDYKIMAVKVCEGVTVRPKWELGIRLYPFARFVWERRRNCAYGDSEITYLIPNQIAINRMITASVWAVMMMGMPMLIVNQDVIDSGRITNDPGQIIPVHGGVNDVQASVRYVNPPNFSPAFGENVNSLISNTLTQAGANDAALGDMRPENTSAIIAVREAATMPLQQVQNRYYSFCEDIARIWAEFWVTKYGKRSLKQEDDTGIWYFPFHGDRYKDLLISTKIDVGASTLWSESQSIRTLDNLLDRGLIDAIQYLTRLPKGVVPDVTKLIAELRTAQQAAVGMAEGEMPPAMSADGAQDAPPTLTPEDIVSGLSPEHREMLGGMDPNVQAALVRASMNAQSMSPETMPEGAVL